jgi:hypothetical protein
MTREAITGNAMKTVISIKAGARNIYATFGLRCMAMTSNCGLVPFG